MDGQGDVVDGNVPVQPDGGIPARQLSLGAMLTHIPKFTGNNVPLHDWAQRVRGMLKVAGVTAENQGEILLIALEGHAQETVLLRPESERKTLEQVVKILERVYGGRPEAGDLQAQLFHRLQSEEEGLPQYANTLQRIMRQMLTAEPELAQTPGYADRTLRDQFLRGLHNPKIRSALRERLRVENKLTFQEILEEAVSRTHAENCDPQSVGGEVCTHRVVQSESNPSEPPTLVSENVEFSRMSTVELQKQFDDYKEKNRKENGEMQRQLKDKILELERSNQTIRKLQEEIRHLEENLQDHQRAHDESLTKNHLLQQTIKDLQYELDAKNHLKDDRSKQVKSMEDKISQLELELDEEKNNSDLLLERITRCREQVDARRTTDRRKQNGFISESQSGSTAAEYTHVYLPRREGTDRAETIETR